MDLLLDLDREEDASGLGVQTALEESPCCVRIRLGPGVALECDAANVGDGVGSTVATSVCWSAGGEGGPR